MACILVIHHDPILLYIFETLLKQDHDEILSCSRIDESLKVIGNREGIEGIVFDLDMVKAGWWRLYQRVQKQIGRSQRMMPTLAVSSHFAQTEAQAICDEFQVDAYLALPVEPQRFRQGVRNLVWRTQSVTDPKTQNYPVVMGIPNFEIQYDEAYSILS